MSVPPVVQLEARLRREALVPPGDRMVVAIPGARDGEAWSATWGEKGRVWSARTVDECNSASYWSAADDGEGGLVIVTTRSGRAVEEALGRRRHRPPQVRVHPGQIWADRAAEGRTILITDPDDGGRVRYKTLTLATARHSGKPWGRITRQSLLSAYKMLPPDDPAYEQMRRDVAVRYPERWQADATCEGVTAWFSGDARGTLALGRWLESEAAWLAFRDWAFATEEA